MSIFHPSVQNQDVQDDRGIERGEREETLAPPSREECTEKTERLDGTVAFLTGASSSTRTATASALARQGAAVIVLGLRSLHGVFRAVNPARRLTPRASLERKRTQTSIPGQGASR